MKRKRKQDAISFFKGMFREQKMGSRNKNRIGEKKKPHQKILKIKLRASSRKRKRQIDATSEKSNKNIR